MTTAPASSVVVDSSVFVSALAADETQHDASRRFFDRLADRRATVIIPALVVLEVGNVLIRKGRLRSSPAILAFRARFDDLEMIPLDDAFISRALVLFPRFSLRTADAILAVTALLAGAVLVSWDRRLLRGAAPLVTTATPADFLVRSPAAR